jgi:hypothetical protein
MRGRATHDEMAAWFEISRRNIGAILDGRSWPEKRLPTAYGQETVATK